MKYREVSELVRTGSSLFYLVKEVRLNLGDHVNPRELEAELLERASMLREAMEKYEAAAAAVREINKPKLYLVAS